MTHAQLARLRARALVSSDFTQAEILELISAVEATQPSLTPHEFKEALLARELKLRHLPIGDQRHLRIAVEWAYELETRLREVIQCVRSCADEKLIADYVDDFEKEVFGERAGQ